MTSPISIVDLFSGPGGLGEGFASIREDDTPAYKIAISIEKERAAHSTLRLRAFLRHFATPPRAYLDWLRSGGEMPDWAALHPEAWAEACQEARCLELGTAEAAQVLEERITALQSAQQTRTLLIGGPPCQAYSLAGRSRNAGIPSYDALKDHRNFLYEEYVRVLNRLEPVAFVMENVKGILSSSIEGRAIFSMVMRDLRAAGPGYQLISLSAPTDLSGEPAPRDFIVRAEDFGVPQTRHRVIIVGIRSDVAARLPKDRLPRLSPSRERISVARMISRMPGLRSGLSRSDSAEHWRAAMLAAIDQVRSSMADSPADRRDAFEKELREVERSLNDIVTCGRESTGLTVMKPDLPARLASWISGRSSGIVANHDTRGHMASDLARYLFAACHAKLEGISPRAGNFPPALAPDHRNWTSGKFNDRFRVQLAHQPATTITSHISKDGHYFIHPDPSQCRSLTVREAARLQTFPDDYVFLGNRTEQYVQVGNAVPPWLARQIAEALIPVYDSL